MQLAGCRPDRLRWASPRASALSLLRPGPCFTCAAWTRKTVKTPSKRGETGRHYAPVLAIATWVIPPAASQSANASRARVMVPNACSSMLPSACCPVGSGVTRHAITVFFWTSPPAPCVKPTSMAHLRGRGGLAGYPCGALRPGGLDLRREADGSPWGLQVSRSNSLTGAWHQMLTDLEASPCGPMRQPPARPLEDC